jgi:hypothetical protein
VLCFLFVCLRPVYCVPNVTSVSGLSILDCCIGFLYGLLMSFDSCTLPKFLFVDVIVPDMSIR